MDSPIDDQPLWPECVPRGEQHDNEHSECEFPLMHLDLSFKSLVDFSGLIGPRPMAECFKTMSDLIDRTGFLSKEQDAAAPCSQRLCPLGLHLAELECESQRPR